MPVISSSFRVKTDPQKQVRFRTRSIKFGDGYEQRAKDGINIIQESWSVTFTLNYSQKEALESILKEAAGVGIVDWQPPGASQQKQWLVRSYQVNRFSDNLFEIPCTLELLNEP